jgi:hypothetical protein
VEGQDEGLNAAHGGEAAGAVERERGGAGGFGLNGQAGGAGGSGGLADGLQQRAAGSAAPGAGDYVQVTQLPEAAQRPLLRICRCSRWAGPCRAERAAGGKRGSAWG